MKTYGLLGYPLGHSFSKDFFTKKFAEEHIRGAEYLNFSLPEISAGIPYLKSLNELAGLNVTIPYKVAVIPFLDVLSETVASIRSCNCIRVTDGKWFGYNTDVIGFERSLLPLLQPFHRQALIFGTGGASKAVVYVLDKLGIGYSFVSRSKQDNTFMYDELNPEIIAHHQVLINTTPVGMAPHSNELPALPYDAITKNHLAYDLIYNPAKTMFLKAAAQHGAVTKNGMEMLLIQAEESWNIWNRL